ncbi:MAG: hypothetical protein V1926_02235 [Candidatus Peregrinibacteria bacterium]
MSSNHAFDHTNDNEAVAVELDQMLLLKSDFERTTTPTDLVIRLTKTYPKGSTLQYKDTRDSAWSAGPPDDFTLRCQRKTQEYSIEVCVLRAGRGTTNEVTFTVPSPGAEQDEEAAQATVQQVRQQTGTDVRDAGGIAVGATTAPETEPDPPELRREDFVIGWADPPLETATVECLKVPALEATGFHLEVRRMENYEASPPNDASERWTTNPAARMHWYVEEHPYPLFYRTANRDRTRFGPLLRIEIPREADRPQQNETPSQAAPVRDGDFQLDAPQSTTTEPPGTASSEDWSDLDLLNSDPDLWPQDPALSEDDFEVTDDRHAEITITYKEFEHLKSSAYALQSTSRNGTYPPRPDDHWETVAQATETWDRDQEDYFVYYRLVDCLLNPVDTPIHRVLIPKKTDTTASVIGTPDLTEPPAPSNAPPPDTFEHPELSEEWPEPDFSDDDTATERMRSFDRYLAACLRLLEEGAPVRDPEHMAESMQRACAALSLQKNRGLAFDIRTVDKKLLRSVADRARVLMSYPWPGEQQKNHWGITRFMRSIGDKAAWLLGDRWLQKGMARMSLENPPPHADTSATKKQRALRREFGNLTETIDAAARPVKTGVQKWVKYARAFVLGMAGTGATKQAVDMYIASKPDSETGQAQVVSVEESSPSKPASERPSTQAAEAATGDTPETVSQPTTPAPAEKAPTEKVSQKKNEAQRNPNAKEILSGCTVTRNGNSVTVHVPFQGTPYTPENNVRIFVGVVGGGAMIPVPPGQLTFDLAEQCQRADPSRLRCCVRVGTSPEDKQDRVFGIE